MHTDHRENTTQHNVLTLVHCSLTVFLTTQHSADDAKVSARIALLMAENQSSTALRYLLELGHWDQAIDLAKKTKQDHTTAHFMDEYFYVSFV